MTPRRKRRRYDRPIVMTPAMFAAVRWEAQRVGAQEAQARLNAHARQVQAAAQRQPGPPPCQSDWMD